MNRSEWPGPEPVDGISREKQGQGDFPNFGGGILMGTPEVMFVIRWFHFLAGITWIGLLYYLNLVNVRFVPNIPAEVRPQIVPLNLGRVLAWFRHSAWVTVLMGF